MAWRSLFTSDKERTSEWDTSLIETSGQLSSVDGMG